jgi:hypothetical protein
MQPELYDIYFKVFFSSARNREKSRHRFDSIASIASQPFAKSMRAFAPVGITAAKPCRLS